MPAPPSYRPGRRAPHAVGRRGAVPSAVRGLYRGRGQGPDRARDIGPGLRLTRVLLPFTHYALRFAVIHRDYMAERHRGPRLGPRHADHRDRAWRTLPRRFPQRRLLLRHRAPVPEPRPGDGPLPHPSFTLHAAGLASTSVLVLVRLAGAGRVRPALRPITIVSPLAGAIGAATFGLGAAA
jgi:hypothetical protein